MSVIRLRSLTKSYGPRVGIREVDLDVPSGCIFGFIGPNGAGKTTAIRIAMGFLSADRGSATILGHDCWRESAAIKRDVGYVPGDLRLHSWLTGETALGIVGGVRELDLEPAGRELAEYFDLDLTVRVRSMSRGMRQKLGLVLALAHAPQLLILDEPTSGLDPLAQDRLSARLRAMAEHGHTVFFSSHVLSEVQDLCERIAIIRRGQIVEDASLAELRERAERTVTIRWNDRVPAPPPPAVMTVVDPSASTWDGRLTGPIAALIAWLDGKPIQDLVIAPPDLDRLFRSFYPSEGDDS